MSPPDNLQSEALAAVVDYYGWTDMAIIVERSAYGKNYQILFYFHIIISDSPLKAHIPHSWLAGHPEIEF